MDNLIEKYHLGTLAPADLEKFEANLKTDAALQNAVAEQRLEWEARELLVENALRAKIRAKFAEKPPETTSSFFQKNWKWMLPVCLLLGLAGFFYFQKAEKIEPIIEPKKEVLPEKKLEINPEIAETDQKSTISPKKSLPKIASETQNLRKLAIAAYQTPDNLSSTRGTDNSEILERAQRAFSEKNYQKTVDLLQILPENESQDALLVRAHAYFLLKKFVKSVADFEQLKTGGIYRREAEWFGFLANMAANNLDKNDSKSSLEAIKNQQNHPFQKEASKLFEQIF